MRSCQLALLFCPLLVFQAAAQSSGAPTLKPSSSEFANTYGSWVTGKAFSVGFSREGGTTCQPVNADVSQMGGGFTWTSGGAEGGTLSGVFSAVGQYKFSLSVVCASGNAGLTYNITVSAPMSMMEGPFLATGNVGAVYGTFLRRNGVRPFNLALTSGAVPPGLQWDADSGVLVGAPASAGTFEFRVRITDRMGTSGEGAYTLVIGPPGGFYTTTNLLEFQAMVGGATETALLGVATSDLTEVNYAVTSDAAWVTAAPASGKTPGALTVQMNPSGLPKGDHQAHLQLTPDGGKSPVTVAVSVRVKDPSPLIGAAPERVQVDVLPDVEAPRQFQLDFQAWNAGSGTLRGTVSAWSEISGTPWLSVQPAEFSAASGQIQTLTVSVNARGLAPGSYRGNVQIVSSEAQAVKQIPVLLVVPKTQHVPILKLSSSSWNTGPDWYGLDETFDYDNSAIWVSNDDTASTFNFTAALTGFGANGYVEPVQGAVGAWPGAAELNFRFSNGRLGAGLHEGLLTVTAPGAKNSPAYAKVRLDIEQTSRITGSATVMDVRSETPIVVNSAGTADPLQVRVVFTNPSNVPVSYRVVSDQPNAVTIDAPAGTVSKANPVTVTASLSADRLALQERGMRLAVQASSIVGGATLYLVPAVVITPVSGSGASARMSGMGTAAAAACSASGLVLGAAAPASGFRRQADEPLKIRAAVYDDCGSPVSEALVSASFSNGDAAVMLPLVDAAKGIYEASWIPGAVAPSVAVTLRATRTGRAAATQKIFGSVTADSGGPVILNGGVVNAVKSVQGDPSCPGCIVAIYGRNLANGIEQSSSMPLPRTLAGAKVLIGGIEAPLFYASPGQINAQTPAELAPDAPYSVVVVNGNRVSTPKPLQLVKLDPGVMAFADGRIIAQHADYSLITSSAPARPGETIILYLVGLGSTTPPVASGVGTPYPPLTNVDVPPVITIGGVAAKVNWAGLVPGAAGLYQIVCAVPDSAQTGELPLALSQESVASNQVRLPVAR